MKDTNMRTVVCTTENCENNGLEIEVENNGSQVICGVCFSILEEEDTSKVQKYLTKLLAENYPELNDNV